jgi:phage terminase large subunit-like protein
MPDAARIPGGTQVGLQLHAGVVHFREDAPLLDELMAECLDFWAVRHDDQVDSISQALAVYHLA